MHHRASKPKSINFVPWVILRMIDVGPERNMFRALAVLLFCLAATIPFSEILRGDMSDLVPIFPRATEELPTLSENGAVE